MPLIPTGELVAQARAKGRGIGAFNAICLEHAEAIALGAEAAGQSAIIQISENAVKFHRRQLGPLAMACAQVARGSSAALALHLDHVEDIELLHQADDFGFGSVMYDGSTLAYADNVAATRDAVVWGHSHGLWVESELGEVGGKDGAHAPGVRTDPAEAAAFVAATGVDGLAVAVGSSHAMLDRSAALDHPLITEIAAAVGIPLVLHGSSGVPDEELRHAVTAGMVKINVGTALNIAFTGAVRGYLDGDEKVVDPRKYIAPGREAMAEVVAHFIDVLN
jgi:fructose-bisphosphate aldolase, class II